MKVEHGDLPLAGIRVISFEQFGAAPYATMFLADFGAEVLKAETPEGDFARRTAPLTLGDGDSLYYQSMNLNKKSIVIDLNDAGDRAFFTALVPECDVVINNLRGTAAAKLGLDYASLGHLKSSLVCGHISAFGRENSRADRPGYDFLMQAEAGLMSLTGEPGGPPSRIGVSMVDYMTGMMLAFGVVSAVLNARRSGRGTDVDACLFDTALHQLGYQGAWYLNETIATERTPRSAHPSNTPVQLFRTADGWVYVACMTEKFWRLLTPGVGRADLLDDVRFLTQEMRLKNRDALTGELDAAFGGLTTAEWVARLGASVPIAPVHTIAEALDSPFVAEIDMIGEVAHRGRGAIRVLANPVRIGGRRLAQSRAPALGEHDAPVRARFGGSAVTQGKIGSVS